MGCNPDWLRYPRAVADELRATGMNVANVRAHVSTTIPVGAGLSSSAALELAGAIARGHRLPTDARSAAELAQLTRRAEHRAEAGRAGKDQLPARGRLFEGFDKAGGVLALLDGADAQNDGLTGGGGGE